MPAALPRYAPTYTGSNEVGAALAVFGRGTQRGGEVVTGGLTNGWLWGADDGVPRWGSNRVESIASLEGADYLYATFDHGAGPDECHLSTGDSGGAAFVLADGRWQLAGIHYSVDGSFNVTNSGVGFDAAIDDEYGLYIDNSNHWELVTRHVASGFYSSRVSAHYAWITQVIPDFDSDANGIPDAWELRYSGSIHGLVATNDPDHDRFDNLAEWTALTDPTNALSFFSIAAITNSNGAVTVSFLGRSNRFYRVFATEDLAHGSWDPATSNSFPGAEGPTAWTDTNLPPVRFYRVGFSVEP